MFEFSLIGAGNMACELGRRLISYGGFNPGQIVASHYNPLKAENFQNKTGIHTVLSNREAVENSKWVILCIRPQQARVVIDEISPAFRVHSGVLISAVVGLRLPWLAERMKTNHVIHFHPSSLLMATDQWNPGASLWLAHSDMDHEPEEELRAIFYKAVGELLVLSDEEQLPSLIFLAGNSPAYLLRIIKAFVDCASQDGASVDTGRLYRILIKSLYMGLVSEEKDPSQIIERIATKQGITQTGLDLLQQKIDPLISDLSKATIARVREIESIVEES